MASPAEDLIAAAQRNVGQARAAGASASEIAIANEKESYSLLEAVSLNAGADKVLAEEAWKATNTVEQAKARARQAAGGEAKMLELISATVQGGDKVRALASEVERKNNRSIFDLVSDPVGTIKDLVDFNGTEGQLKGAIQTTSATALAASQRHTALQHGFKEAEDAKQTATAATLQAATDKIDAIRMENATKARIQGRMYNLEGVKTALQMSVQEAQSYSTIFGTVQAVEQQKLHRAQLAISQQNAALAQKNHDLQLREVQERAKARGEVADEMAVVGSSIANGMSAAGLKAPEGAALRIAIKEALTDKNSPFFQYYAIGLRNQALGSNVSRVGSTPAESFAIASRKDISMAIPDAVQPTMAILREAATLVKGVDRKTQPEAWNNAYDTAVSDLMKAESTNITSTSMLDVGKALSGYIQNSPSLSALPISQKFFAPMIQAGQSISDPVVTLKLGAEAVAKGVLTSNELIGGMTAVYRQAAIVHAHALRLNDFGIITPYEAGSDYNVKLGYGDRINLTNSTELSRWLARHLTLSTMPGVRAKQTSEAFREALSGDSYARTIKNY